MVCARRCCDYTHGNAPGALDVRRDAIGRAVVSCWRRGAHRMLHCNACSSLPARPCGAIHRRIRFTIVGDEPARVGAAAAAWGEGTSDLRASDLLSRATERSCVGRSVLLEALMMVLSTWPGHIENKALQMAIATSLGSGPAHPCCLSTLERCQCS